ncbi:MAG: hypothetical protein AB7Q17_12515 [Phycisphaerae bacterium]
MIFALIATLAGLALSLWMAALSDGVHHDDDLVHLLYARWSFDYPAYLLHEWGRPGFTVLYAIPAQFGWFASRAFSGVLTALTAWCAFRIAQRLGAPRAWTAPAFVWLQPMTFTLSYTTLTEPVLALYLALAMRLFLARRFAWSAAVVSLCAVTRHEALLFLALWAAALWRERRPLREWLPLAWAPLVHNVLSHFYLWEAPLMMFLRPAPTDEYGSGAWWSMLARWPLAAGVGPLLLGCVGAPLLFRTRGGALWVACGAAYFVAHSVLYRYGLFATGGYYRFLAPLAPLLATGAAAALGAFAARGRDAERRAIALLLALAGVTGILWAAIEAETPDWLAWLLVWSRYGALGMIALCVGCAIVATRARGLLRRVALALPPLALVVLTFWQPVLARGVQPPFTQCAPLRLVDDQLLVREAVDWLRESHLADRTVVAANLWVYEFLGRSLTPFRPNTRQQLEQLKPGELFLWDRRYCPSPAHRIPLEELEQRADLALLWHGGEHPRDGVFCYIFERRPTP